MLIRFSSVVTSASGWGLKILVFAVLFGIGWWGHHTHWTLPAIQLPISEVFAAESTPDAPADRLAIRDFPSRLPFIEFSSVDAVRNCGIEVQMAEERAMDEEIIANGVVGFDQTRVAQLATRVPGIVWRVDKRIGDAVQTGDVLVIVDSAEVGQAKATLLEATVVHNLKEQTLRRLESVPNAIPRREVREAEAAFEVSRVQRFNAVQKLVNFGFPIQDDEIAKLSVDELTKRLRFLGLPPNVAAEASSANLIPLVVPFPGVITQCSVARGEMVEPSKPQYVVADMRRMWIHLDIQQEYAPRLKLGATAMIRSEPGIDPIPCKITWIGTEVDPRTRTIQARAEADNPFQDAAQTNDAAPRKLRSNAFCLVVIRVTNNPTAVVVPNAALHWVWEIGHEVVFVASEDQTKFQPRIVNKGLKRSEYVEIVKGLKAGERVVTAGSRILSSELSERLQTKVGENADAVRNFDNAQIPGANAQ
jgi:cobalt-zinc-cadmium efflux system membrane fusion protein